MIELPCPDCNGDGFLSTGDRQAETRTDVCPTCRGRMVIPASTGETPEASARPATPLSQDGEGLRALSEKATPGPWYHCQAFKTVPAEMTIHGRVPAQRVDYVSNWPGLGTPEGYRGIINMEGRESHVSSDDMAFIVALENAYRSGDLIHRSSLPTTPTDGGRDEREAVARIIDPAAWALWDKICELIADRNDPFNGDRAKAAQKYRIDTAPSLAKADAILARQQPPHTGGDAVREKLVVLSSLFSLSRTLALEDAERVKDRDELNDYRCGKLGQATAYAEAKQVVDRILDAALASTPPAPGDGKPDSFFDRRVSMGAPTAEPSIRMMARVYYRQVFDEQKAQELADRFCATLATPGESDAGPGWRPIETAPKDGTYVMGFGRHETRGEYFDVIHFWNDRWTIEWMHGYGAPTHWMPLPAAPASSQSKGE